MPRHVNETSSIQTARRIISEVPTTRSSKKDQSDARETFIGISDAGLPFVRPSPRDSQAAVLGSPAVRSKKRVQSKTRALWRHAEVKRKNPLPRFSRVSRLLRLWSSRPAKMRWNHANIWEGSLFKVCEQQTRPNITMVKFYIDMM